MKKLLRTTISLALCAVLLLFAAAPAFASTDNHSHIDYGLGVQVDCSSVLNAIRAKGTITLSFVPNVNHLQESDYCCSVYVVVVYSEAWSATSDSGICGMTATAKVIHGSRQPLSAYFIYHANYSFMHDITLY